MRLLFVENRQQTWFWEAVAKELIAGGHEVYWLVQNHAFTPRAGHVFRVPYPTKRDLRSYPTPAELASIAIGDRNVLYFGGNTAHYGYYDAKIGEVLDAVQPDIGFGETTLFHESLTVRHCRQRGIPYLQPHITRYPVGRYSFLQYDTLEPLGGSDEVLDAATALEMARAIAERRLALMYQGQITHGPVASRSMRVVEAMRVLFSWWRGERYNTPHPLRKLALERNVGRRRKAWDDMARTTSMPRAGVTTILYPMQMQPEANLDIWGQAHRDQGMLLRRMLAGTSGETMILVKPNPSSKYELDEGLIELVSGSPRLIPLTHASSMTSVMPAVDVVATVTGTVAIEAFCAGKPLVSFARGLVDDASPRSIYLERPEEVGAFAVRAREGSLPETTDQQRIAYLQRVVRNSYPGDISNPFSTAGVTSADNIAKVTRGFQHILSRLESSESERSAAAEASHISAD